MPQAARLTDPLAGTDGVIASNVARTVYINGLPAAFVDSLSNDHAPYGIPHPPHVPNPIVAGSTTVKTEGHWAARQGDPFSCGHVVASGSPDVYIAVSNAATPNTDYKLSLPSIVAKEAENDDDPAEPESTPKEKTDSPLAPVEEDNTPTDPPPLPDTDCANLPDPVPMNYQLTDNYTLKQFVHDLPAIPSYKQRAIPAQMGLTPSEIVCNLQILCREIWEPLKARYPKALITNNLRTGSRIGGGAHGTGQAMDVQFSGLSAREYFEIAQWIKNSLPYDQLLLEYHTKRPRITAWLHISIYNGVGRPARSGSQVMTMMNHRVHTRKLVNLA
jgi:uncharacterized Zn-binding protein involved in type VI secretion